MIQIQHLTITHTKDLRELVHDLNLTIATGEKVAIIGEEGNGKSSLLALLVNPKAHFDHLSYEGTINKPDSPQVYIPQQISDDLQSLTLNDYFFADTYDLDYATLYRLADELHFDSERFASSQLISTLSGGEKLKIQFIRELARPHDIIFLDEPSNDMDLTTITWLKDFIKHSDKTIIYISHDEDLLSQTADTIIHLELLKRRRQARTSVEHLDYDNYSQQRTDAFQQKIQQAKTEKKAYDKAMAKHRRIKQNVQTTLRNTHDSTQGRLLAKKMKAVLSQEKRYDRLAQDMTQMPDKEDSIELFFSHIDPLPQGKYLLNLDEKQINIAPHLTIDHLKLSLKGQEKIGIVGDNGCGKSTLLHYLYQELNRKTDLTIGYMPQDYDLILKNDLSPIAFLCKTGDKTEKEIISSHLANLNFSHDEMNHAIDDLSGGQKGKLLLLHLVLENPQLLILDEPTRNFSPTSQPQVRQLFENYPGAILTVSHDVNYLRQVCQKIYRLESHGLKEVEI
ncbi:ATP-binding cassette domain-containing protein [Streptococcus salivarius]|uniref:ATP-binding cassette domain-containing protein n=1 Tax=Streptococcus salivarius TaxID=1304 RepID=UPI0012BD314C|nr:ATP-binding cassette domain-containing protein [Streptococcus salivarius]MTQ47815.1 ATP-binding cassette domain-containing protein [Streptococcus salivarius]